MGEKIVVGPKFGGLVNAVEPFAIDNESFPFLLNAYEWRGRIKRKRGTYTLGRLQRYFNSTNSSYTNLFPPYYLTLDGTGAGNLFSGPYVNAGMTSVTLQPGGNIIPGTVVITDTVTSDVYKDTPLNGTLVGSPTGTGTINYASGEITIAGGAGHALVVVFLYYPALPVMGLRSLNLTATQFPATLGFDTVYSYNIVSSFPNSIYDVSFYKNPPSAEINGFAYVQKTNVTPLTWNGQNYQQFWSYNYQNAFWVTNGIPVPFIGTNIGMQFQEPIEDGTTWLTPQTMSFEINNCPLVVGDWVFVNEFTIGAAQATSLNFQTGFVSSVLLPISPSVTSTITVTFPYAVIADAAYSNGIIQYLTNRAFPTKDCIRWYDGDPTNGIPTNPVLSGNLGWVNFAPPLSNLDYSIDELPPAQYYLVGARMIVPFKNRMLFFGAVVQSSSSGPFYLQDTIVYSQVGTAYYTASFDGSSAISAKTVFNPLLVPINQTATANAYWEDQTGLGGYLTAGYEQPITTVSPNEDVLIVGFNSRQARLIYSGDDIFPFALFVINSELGSGSTFSIINLDRNVLTIGEHGFVATSQIGAERFDMDIPDDAFEFKLSNNGQQRITAQRDFVNEWIYFTYCSNENDLIFPTQTLQYNYREKTWGLFNECYTTYGQFRQVDGLTWASVGDFYPTWESWNEPWNAGGSTVLQPKVIGGTPQGFVMQRDEGTNEGYSIYISNISFPATITNAFNGNPTELISVNSFSAGQTVMIMGVNGMTQLNGNTYTILAATPTTVTIDVDSTLFGAFTSGGMIVPLTLIYSPNHCLNNGDYIVISGVIGTLSTQLNGNIFSVFNVSEDGFNIDPTIFPGTYVGGGLIKRMYVPSIQTKQFNPSWGLSRKTRIGVQQYLFTKTPAAQITLLIYLSQNGIGQGAYGYNSGPILPAPGSLNDALIYNTILYTCPELPIINSINVPLGNLGNGIEITIPLNLQANLVPGTVFIQVGAIATFTDNGTGGFSVTGTGVSSGSSVSYSTGMIVLVFSVAPSAQTTTANFNYYGTNLQSPTALYQEQIWHRINTSLLGDTVQLGFTMSDAQMRDPGFNNQFEEIELHSFVIDVTPSQLLA
jgi:hypothetical protein